MPVTCDDCGASVRLTGLRLQLALFGALFAVLTVVFFSSALDRLHAIHPLAPQLGVAVVLGAFFLHGTVLSKRLMRWELGASTAGPDETSLARGTARNWPYLVPAALFGPVLQGFGGMHGLRMPVIALLFFGSLGAAMVPIISGRAPFGFWALALVAWIVGIVLGIVVFT